MADEKGNGMKAALDWFCGICAFLTVVVYVLLIINAKWEFLPADLFNVLVIARMWAPLAVVAIAGLEFCSGKSFIFKLIFLAACAVIVISMFFPETWESVVGMVNGYSSPNV